MLLLQASVLTPPTDSYRPSPLVWPRCNGTPSCGAAAACAVSVANKCRMHTSLPPSAATAAPTREMHKHTRPGSESSPFFPVPPAEQPAASRKQPSPPGSRASPTARATAASLTTPTALAQSSPTPARAPTALPSQQHPARAPAATSSSRSWRLMPVSSPFSLCPPPHTHTRTCTQACTLPACCTLLDVCTPHTHFDLSGMLQLILTRAPPPPFSSCLQTLPARAPPRGLLPP